MILTEAIAIGLVAGFFFYEWIGLSPGGLVVPGYIALAWDRPLSVALTLLLALLVYVSVEGLSRFTILYGRRRFLLMLLAGFAGKWLLAEASLRTGFFPVETDTLGYIIPGLIANEMARQGIAPTVGALIAVSTAVRLILILFGYIRS
jgi:poly-gamma-glutamate biosynthesis protein PgsC/CapC